MQEFVGSVLADQLPFLEPSVRLALLPSVQLLCAQHGINPFSYVWIGSGKVGDPHFETREQGGEPAAATSWSLDPEKEPEGASWYGIRGYHPVALTSITWDEGLHWLRYVRDPLDVRDEELRPGMGNGGGRLTWHFCGAYDGELPPFATTYALATEDDRLMRFLATRECRRWRQLPRWPAA